MIKAIFGLGNPGDQYDYTPHNVGFALLDSWGVTNWEKEKNCLYTRQVCSENSFFLVKPQTFMNVSGKCVQSFTQNKPITTKECMVVYDDAELEIGRVRLVYEGGARGHNGLRSVIGCVGPSFWRLGVGVGRDPRMDLGSYVLKRLPLNLWESILTVFENIFDNEELLLSADPLKSSQFVRNVNGC
ncbi:MAG: aminoacyl-tRNA hydrolase [Alphaproteobacteria bacterium]|nr:aminoacyl-tRNA hydrolase [Alphaproteobacteria bacterium]